jgi:MFS family permease
VATACFFMAMFTWGFGFYGHSVYLAELQELYGWPSSLIAGASTATYLLGAALASFVNNVMEWFGPRRLVLVGAIALWIAVSLVAFIAEPWQLYAVYPLMAVGWLAMGPASIILILSYWFERRRGLAISLALNGASFGGILVVPLLVFLVDLFAFRNALLIAAALLAIILLPIVVTWIDERPGGPTRTGRPPEPASSMPWTRRTALSSLPFWTIAGPFALALLAQVGFIVHQIALLAPTLDRTQAGAVVMLTTVMAVVGRLALGAVVDRLNPRLAAAGTFASQALALLGIAFTRDPLFLSLCCAVYGFSVGNLITLPPLVLHREFPLAAFGMLIGLATAIIALASALGPVLIGLVRDLSGSYFAALMLCFAVDAIAAGVVLLGARPGSAVTRL